MECLVYYLTNIKCTELQDLLYNTNHFSLLIFTLSYDTNLSVKLKQNRVEVKSDDLTIFIKIYLFRVYP